MLQAQYNTEKGDCQEQPKEILHDVSGSGKERPWHVRKLENQYISAAYSEVNKEKAVRLDSCAQALLFGRAESGKLKLLQAGFCRVRLCPICAWRRSMKTHAHMSKILEAAKPENYSYQMVTLTLRNCSGNDLSATLDKLIGGYHKLVRRKAFIAAWKGWYRGVEVTHNQADDTYHPHIHALVAVKKSYYKSKQYISQEALTQAWRECCDLDYDPIVHIQKTYGNTVKAVAEVAKYSTKTSDIVCFDDWDFTVETVRVLDAAFNRRRFIAYGGKFKELHKQLNLDDTENGDLVHVDDEDMNNEKATDELLFWWHVGYARYVR